MTKRKALSLRLAMAALVVAASAIGAGTASAHASAPVPGKYTQGCPAFTTTQPFLSWADAGYYFLGPAGPAADGNETYYVNAKSDSHSLSLPKGASAASPSICVTLDTPDLRLFVKNTGSSTANLTINMTYTNDKGKASTVTVAKLPVAAKANWAPTVPVLFLANIQAILSNNNQTWVTFQLVSDGSLLVDDFYVDPIKHH
jgi:hypothetical protein